MVKFVVGAFAVIVLGLATLVAVDGDHAQLFIGAIALVSVLGTVVTFGVLLHVAPQGTADHDRREAYARVMIALVTATAGTVGGVGGGAVVSNNQTGDAEDKADKAQRTADQAQKKAADVESGSQTAPSPTPRRPRQR